MKESLSRWVFDPTHSELTFKVRHMMITNVKGAFNRFSIEALGSDILKAQLTVKVDAASIDTNNEQRDGHLRSADFFDTENHGEILFNSTSFVKKTDDTYQLKGILSMKGISHEIALTAEFGGINRDPWGNEKAGFSIEGSINRKDWGLNWNAALETGGVLVSDEVKIYGEVQFAKQVEA